MSQDSECCDMLVITCNATSQFSINTNQDTFLQSLVQLHCPLSAKRSGDMAFADEYIYSAEQFSL